ncbi:CPBP family intramembrane metalloprotease [Brevibacterium luteolum]|uniref:CPBP family intramembrane metalloprotease n=2 Tax=Brevibacterium luteolum TaxID=199591 RepID=A0A6G8KVT7_9MICO|nr:CPBP family intramembrane metalloprotease [Brevibacterium luteolum]
MHDDQPGHPDPTRSPHPQPHTAPGPETGRSPDHHAAPMAPAASVGQPTPAGAPYAAADLPAADPSTAPSAAERGQTHSEFYRLPSNRWWKGVITIVALLITMLVASFVFTLIAGIIDLATGQLDIEAAMEGEIGMSPLMLLATNLSLIALAVVALIFHRFLFRQRIGFLNSVVGRFRWTWLLWSLIPIGIGFAIYITLLVVSSDWDAYAPLPAGMTIFYLVVVLLTTPFQAAAEEYVFRGVIQRIAGSWVRGPIPSLILGTAVSSVLFAAAHMAGDPWLILYYWLFGVFLSLLAHYSGGLEEPIVIHAINNVALFVTATFSGEIAQEIDRSAGAGGPFMLIPVAAILVVSAAAIILARVRSVQMYGVAEEIPRRGAATTGAPVQQWGAEAPAPLPYDHYARADAGQPPAPEAAPPQHFGTGWQDGNAGQPGPSQPAPGQTSQHRGQQPGQQPPGWPDQQ